MWFELWLYNSFFIVMIGFLCYLEIYHESELEPYGGLKQDEKTFLKMEDKWIDGNFEFLAGGIKHDGDNGLREICDLILIGGEDNVADYLSLDQDIRVICWSAYWPVQQDTFTRSILDSVEHKVIFVTLHMDFYKDGWIEKYIDHPKLYKWITQQNPLSNHPKMVSLPLGLGRGWQRAHLKSHHENFKNATHEKLLLASFRDNNPERKKVLELVENEWSDFSETVFHGNKNVWQESEQHVYDMFSQYKFILSPKGGGYDSHRTWEALYVNSIPIVLSSPLDSTYEQLPILVVKNWNEITEEFLQEKYLEFKSRRKYTYSFNLLSEKYWKNYIFQLRWDLQNSKELL